MSFQFRAAFLVNTCCLQGGVICLCLSVLNQITCAEVPAVTAIYPAGGQAGQTINAKLQGATGTAPVVVWTDRNDLTARMGEKPDELIVTTTPETRPGVAWLRWHNAEGASELRPFVIGTAVEINEIDPNDSPKEAQNVASLPVTINGTLNRGGDLDTYAVTLQAGQTLVASLEASRMLPSPMDGVLQLVDSNGFVIAQNEDTNAFDPQLVWTAPADGRWLVRVFSFPMEPNSSIQYFGSPNSIYRLHLTTGPFVTHMSPLYRQSGEVFASGWNLSDPKLVIMGEPGQRRFQPLPSGVVPYLPFDFEQLPAPVGELITEDQSSSRQAVPLHASISGVLENPGDVDSYQLRGVKGQTIHIQTTTRTLGSLLDPFIRLRSVSGALLKEQDDAGESADVSFAFTFPSDEDYVIEITDRFTLGGPQFFYALTVGPETPRFELSLAANRYTLDHTKPTEIPVTISRIAGHHVPITFTVEGLPPGLQLDPIESKPEGDSSKAVTLKLTVNADAAPAQGPIRIIGQSTSPALSFSARGPIDGLKQMTTDQLWITLPAKTP